MKYIYDKLLFLIALEVISNSTSCELKIPAISPSINDLNEIIHYIRAIPIGSKIIDDKIITNIQVLKDVISYKSGSNNEDIHLNITELIQKYGYKVEEHKVQTADGYIIGLQRIPGNGRVVFIMHGIVSSADDFVTAGPDSALAYNLASEGYDVWLGNARGNKHSKSHVTLSPDCAEFWDFSWDEIGRYDLPAMIDYVLNTTGQDKLAYIGWSQGSTSFYVMCSELPEYNEKISLMVALAPVAYMSNLKSPLFRTMSIRANVVNTLLKIFLVNEFFSNEILTRALTNVLCGNNALAKIVCSKLVFMMTGFDLGQLNITNLPVNFGHFPTGSSTKQMIHYSQLIESAKFRRFDYGKSTNLGVYGDKTPPNYALQNVKAPVALFYSDNDWLSSDIDVIKLSKEYIYVESTRDQNAGLYFAQRISLAIQRGNAASILGTLPDNGGSVELSVMPSHSDSSTDLLYI